MEAPFDTPVSEMMSVTSPSVSEFRKLTSISFH